MGLSVRLVRGLAYCSVVLGGLLVGSMAVGIGTAERAVAQSVQSIAVEGNRRVEADTIRSYFRPGPGGQLGPAQIDEGLKALVATGLFADVRISRPGGRIVVTVVEAQVINRVAFEGNKKAKDEQLASEVQSKPRGTLSRATVQADVQRIIEIYQRSGRYDIRVEPKIIELPNNRVDLIFEINEGSKTGVKEINFVGNKRYSSYRLKDVIKTSVSNWLSFLQTTDIYDPDRLEADRDLLRRFYLKNGYADVRILSAVGEYDASRGGFAITFTIDEGEQYRVGTVDITSNVRVLDAESMRAKLRIRAGEVYNADAVQKSVEALTIEAAKRGYAFASVRPQGQRNFETKVINVAFVVEEGARAYIERINIRGNTRTRDYVIRREFEIGEGDAYNRALVDRAERRLNNLNYFKKVKITNEPGSAPDRVVLNVDVEEKSTGNFSVGGGYSTNQGWLAELSVTETNLMGRGQYARGAVQYGEYAKGVELSFAEPYFLGYRVGAGIDLYAKETLATEFILYDIRTVGTNLRMSFPLNEEISLTPRYSIYSQELTLPFTTCVPTSIRKCPSAAYQAAFTQGEVLTSMVGYTGTYNTLDSNRTPTSGSYLELKQDFAGVGGDVEFFKTTVDARHYAEVIPDVIGLLRLQGGIVTGWGDTPLRTIDHFVPGPSIMRGFAPGGLGPRDFFVNTTPGLGGTKYWAATAELQTPLYFLPKEMGMRVAVFTDVGSVWDYQGPTGFCSPTLAPKRCYGVNLIDPASGQDSNSMQIRASGGVGLLWDSPLGPIRFDFAWPFMKEKYDETQWFRFSGGASF